MSTVETEETFTASVRVENEETIKLSPDLTAQLRQFSVHRAGEEVVVALDVLEQGLESHEQALAFAEALREASRHAEVVYALTLGPPEEDA